MAINIADTLQPYPSGRYPIVEGSHVKGGYFSVPEIVDLYNIPLERRTSGMLVYVQSNNAEYRLISGMTNSFWTIVNKHAYQENLNVDRGGYIYHQLGYYPNFHITSASGQLVAGIQHVNNNVILLTYTHDIYLIPGASGFAS